MSLAQNNFDEHPDWLVCSPTNNRRWIEFRAPTWVFLWVVCFAGVSGDVAAFTIDGIGFPDFHPSGGNAPAVREPRDSSGSSPTGPSQAEVERQIREEARQRERRRIQNNLQILNNQLARARDQKADNPAVPPNLSDRDVTLRASNLENIVGKSNQARSATNCQFGTRAGGIGCRRLGDSLAIDPKYFVDQQERNLLIQQIAALSMKRSQLDAQRQKIVAQRSAVAEAAKDQDDLTFELLQDGNVQTLNFLDASIQILVLEGSLPANSGRNLRDLIGAAKIGLNAISAATAPGDSEARVRKMWDVANGIKDISPYRPAGMSEQEWESFRRALNVVPKLADISQRLVAYRRGATDNWKELGKSLDDLVEFGGQYLPPLKMARSYVHMAEGDAALWMVKRDKQAIDSAYIQLTSAKTYYDERIGHVDEFLNFYQERMKRTTNP